MRWRREVPPASTLVAAVGARARAAGEADPVAASLAQSVAAAGGGAVAAIGFFGSRRTGAAPAAQSAYDLFVVVNAYRPFYRALRAAGLAHRRPGLLAALNACLAPNQIAVRGPDGSGGPVAKCAVISVADLRRATSPAASDHFCLGRLAQQAQVVAGPEDGRRELVDALARAHALTYAWARPWLPATFDAAHYGRAFLRVSYAAEIRPEPEGRADALGAAQAAYFDEVYSHLLRGLAAAGELAETAPGVYALVARATAGERLRLAAYFRWSKVRATARWAKYVVTFDGWLDFIVAKARRHSGQDIVLTERERRHPLLFLWPRVLQYLLHKDRPAAGPGRR